MNKMKNLKDTIRTALTMKVTVKKGSRRELKVESVPPSERLILFVQFTMVTITAMTALELVHIVVLGKWNTEIFATMTGLVGTIIGVFFGKKA